jgi:outer membrane protein OmpA-like peptidoglycan-associated protein
MMVILAACQNVDEGATRTETAVQPSGYPDLHTVPPRPQLSYTVEQRRTIVDGLVADRENARYTSEVIRYRAGLSSMPPPPEPKALAAAPSEAEPEPGEAAATSSPGPADERPADRSTGRIDRDDSLDSFMEEMLDAVPPERRQTGAGGEPEARAAPAPEELVRPAAAPRAPPPRPSTTAAPNGPVRAAPPKPQLAAATDALDETRAAGPATADHPAVRPVPKPAPGEPQIEVANGLVEIAVPPAEDHDDAVGSITFGPGSATLPPEAQDRLMQILGAAEAQGARVKIVGEAEAPALALDRARAVGLALVQQGLPADRLEMTLAGGGAGDQARLFLAPQTP